MTATDVILVAAYQLTAEGGDFHEATLTVRAWKMDRKRLGLAGYEDLYPDYKKVYTLVLRCLIRQGYLSRVRPCYYRATGFGRQRAQGLLNPTLVEEARRGPDDRQ